MLADTDAHWHGWTLQPPPFSACWTRARGAPLTPPLARRNNKMQGEEALASRSQAGSLRAPPRALSQRFLPPPCFASVLGWVGAAGRCSKGEQPKQPDDSVRAVRSGILCTTAASESAAPFTDRAASGGGCGTNATPAYQWHVLLRQPITLAHPKLILGRFCSPNLQMLTSNVWCRRDPFLWIVKRGEFPRHY